MNLMNCRVMKLKNLNVIDEGDQVNDVDACSRSFAGVSDKCEGTDEQVNIFNSGDEGEMDYFDASDEAEDVIPGGLLMCDMELSISNDLECIGDSSLEDEVSNNENNSGDTGSDVVIINEGDHT